MKALDPAALACLAALADSGSFERAAQQLAITQSAVSQRLRSLEQQVGRPLVIRARPLQLTEPGRVLLRFARQLQRMQTDVRREMDALAPLEDRVPIAVNADSLATWVLPALDPLVQEGLAVGYGLELIVDDQDFTHEWLRQGAVLGCVSAVPSALRGCSVERLGVMHYVAVASPVFVQQRLGGGLHEGNVFRTPFLVFNRKDDTQSQWVAGAFNVAQPRLVERHVPSSEAYARAALMGWGVGVLPTLQVRDELGSGRLVRVGPDIAVEVALYWHQWRLGGGQPADASPGLLDRVGAAIIAGARRALGAADG